MTTDAKSNRASRRRQMREQGYSDGLGLRQRRFDDAEYDRSYARGVQEREALRGASRGA